MTWLHKVCPVCDKPFKLRKGLDNVKTCSRSCGAKLGHMNKK